MLSLSSPAPLDTSWLLRSGCTAAGGAVCTWAMSWPALGKTCGTHWSDIRLLIHACLTSWPLTMNGAQLVNPRSCPLTQAGQAFVIRAPTPWNPPPTDLLLESLLKALDTFIPPELPASISGAAAKIPSVCYRSTIVLWNLQIARRRTAGYHRVWAGKKQNKTKKGTFSAQYDRTSRASGRQSCRNTMSSQDVVGRRLFLSSSVCVEGGFHFQINQDSCSCTINVSTQDVFKHVNFLMLLYSTRFKSNIDV